MNFFVKGLLHQLFKVYKKKVTTTTMYKKREVTTTTNHLYIFLIELFRTLIFNVCIWYSIV